MTVFPTSATTGDFELLHRRRGKGAAASSLAQAHLRVSAGHTTSSLKHMQGHDLAQRTMQSEGASL